MDDKVKHTDVIMLQSQHSEWVCSDAPHIGFEGLATPAKQQTNFFPQERLLSKAA